MKTKYLILVIIFIFPFCFIYAQTLRHSATEIKNWSTQIPILDRNENKIDISFSFANTLFEGDKADDKNIYFYFKLKNNYKEPISGRILYDYSSTDGNQRQMNCVIYCLQPNQEYFNSYYKQEEVKNISNFRFIEFSSCNSNSNLLNYDAKDPDIYKIYAEIKKLETDKKNGLNSGQQSYSSGAKNQIKPNEVVKDNSDKIFGSIIPSNFEGFEQMNVLQQHDAVSNAVDLFMNELGELAGNGPSQAMINRKAILEETIYKRNIAYREKYGYSVQDFTDAIRGFDNVLLEKILATGFPIDTKVIHDNIYNEMSVLGEYYGTDYYLNGLHYAAIYGNVFAANLFINKGLDINIVAKGEKGFKSNGSTLQVGRAIDFAVLFDRYKIVQLLLSKKVDTSNWSSLFSVYFASAYKIAKEHKYYEIQSLLESYPK